ncbi:MAG: L-serine ammonia-lyase, iron-sulfur-dependent, subunit alpha [Candidatus Cryptobacteroides sp.]|nr:L-serine ammonia-lyase, iron-sulfur-dependent, subunit alpha [Candidatus Cryptobacteroides sp.]
MTHAEIIGIIKQEVKPALGCTEPIAVALAVAKAAEIISENCPCCGSWRMKADFKLDVAVSGNILKNGMGVGIPGTGMVGLPVAAALGAVCGNSSLGLEVLKELTPEAVVRAKELVAKGFVHISVADTEHLLYVKATVTVDANTVASAEVDPHAYAVIEDDHDRIVETSFADKILMSSESAAGLPAEASESPYDLTVQSIWNFAREAPYEDIAFILEDRTLNLALAEEGLRGNYGLQVGKAIRENQKEVFGDDFMSYAMGMTAAASDARMAGSTLPAMSNSGSGNQGITVSMPVIAYALKYKVPDEKLARALILSNLVAIHIKHFLGKLSALCGCVVASTGSACGIVYLEGGGYEQVCAAIKNMAGNITGMVCDGAKVGCAMKVASGVSCAVQSAVLALRGTCIPSTDGIIEDDVEKTIRNIGTIGSAGMKATDRMILEIMLCK